MAVFQRHVSWILRRMYGLFRAFYREFLARPGNRNILGSTNGPLHRFPLYELIYQNKTILHSFWSSADPVFYYHGSWAMSKMKLKSHFAEFMAVGLMTVLIDMPYDIIGIKYVHWIWHDTDPNICKLIFVWLMV